MESSNDEKKYKFNADLRDSQLINMLSEYPIDPTRLVITTFHISSGTHRILYAFIYSEVIGKIIKPRYFCANPSFESKDGEYRPKLCRYENIAVIYTEYPELLEEIDNHLTSKKEMMNWKLSVDSFYTPKAQTTRDKLYERELERNMIADKLLRIIWFNCISNIYHGMIEVHTNARFAKVLGLNGIKLAKDTKFFQELEQQYGDNLRRLRQLQDYFYVKPDLSKAFRLGQKIIPLSADEDSKRYMISYKPWKELAVSIRLADMVVRRICPAFPVIMTHFCVSGSTDLFDNDTQRERIKLSNAMNAASKFLDKAKTVLSVEDVLSDKVATVENMIDDVLTYGQRELIMSNTSLCIISEFMGKTLYNALESAMRSEIYNNYIGNILGNVDTFAKFIFEYMYAFYCAGEKGGIIHSDIHLNNLCVNPVYSTALLKPPPDGKIIYKMQGKVFIMHTTQYYGSIIDFSRCVIKPSMSKRYGRADTKQYSECRIRHLYNVYFPSVKMLSNINLEDDFSRFLLFDPLLLCLKLREYMTKPENSVKFDSSFDTNIKLLDNIVSACRSILTRVTDQTIFDVISGHFSKFISDADHKNNHIVDIYDADSRSQYSLDSFESLPPSFKSHPNMKDIYLFHTGVKNE